MGPLAASWLLEAPPSPVNTRFQPPLGSLQTPPSFWDPRTHFRAPEVALHPPWHSSLAARVGGLVGKQRLQWWGDRGSCAGWCGCCWGPRVLGPGVLSPGVLGVPVTGAKQRCDRSVLQNADGKLTLQEFQEGSKADPSIVQALSLYDGLV